MVQIPFYKDHWVNIEPNRLERYRRTFEWSPGSAPLYEPAGIRSGHIVADFGCGPGHTAIEMAGWVGPEGHVHALDINAEFVSQARENAAARDLDDRITVQQSDGSALPLPDGSLDRVTTRNTIIYVDDPAATFREFRRVLKPGGLAHAIEGDWPMMIAEPVPSGVWQALVEAAGHACRTPDIGRKLYGLLTGSGFTDVRVEVITRPDTDGRLLPMIRNMAAYARGGGKMSGRQADDVLGTLESGLADGRYLVLAPQFVVVGIA